MLIAHLSDPHLRAKGQLYQGLVDTNALFDLALDALLALDPQPDIVILTGDLVDEPTPLDYAQATEKLSRIRQPVYAIPGNHDEREAFRGCLAGAGYLPDDGPLHYVVDGALRVVALDVTVPGEHHGLVDMAAASWLERTLAQAPEVPTLVMMHQPPILSGIDCIDTYNCRGADLLEAVLSRHGQVERLLCGHVHRYMQARFAGTMVITAPSTATSIALRLGPDAAPASVLEPPALLLHDLRPGRPLMTHHVPIGRFPGPFPFF
ncbi:MAG: phosphodiesterase [Rhodobacteraceae bacterium]|nr:phosphodiesterase [Paracoccaceae bacterium]